LRTRSAGFTLAELMVVVSILSLIMAMAAPGIAKANFESREANLKANLKKIRDALLMAEGDIGCIVPATDLTAETAPSGCYTRQAVGNWGWGTTPNQGRWAGPYLKTLPRNPMTGTNTYGPGSCPPTTAWCLNGYEKADVSALMWNSTELSTEGTAYNTW
jgi:prepilin-type N-terminal cleavage/methylation domain-containing protein